MKRVSAYSFKSSSRDDGFTLVEVLIAVALSGIVASSIYTAYRVYQRNSTAQIQVVEMQQNIRAAMSTIMEGLRMAGYDPTGSANAGIAAATAGRLNITKDLTDTAGNADDGDGLLDGPNENIIYGFDVADDAASDGIADNLAAPLGMISGAGPFQAIADNIAAIEFNYTLDDGTKTVAPGSLNDVRSVTISILARAKNFDPDFVDNTIYTSDSGAPWGPFGDNFRRRLLISTVKCRNMGL